MNILVIDTASPIEIVSVLAGDTAYDKTMYTGLSHATTLFGNIDLALKEANIGMKDLNIIGVGTGPGSFTGIRIAVTTARMFSQILNLPLVGIKTPLIYACSAGASAHTGQNIITAFDAKKGRVFGALYTKSEHELKPVEIIGPGDYMIGELIDKVNLKEKTLLIGDGCGKYYEEIKLKIPDHYFIKEFIPAGKIICELVKNIYLQNPDEHKDLNKVLPYYSRKPDVAIVKKLKNASE